MYNLYYTNIYVIIILDMSKTFDLSPYLAKTNPVEFRRRLVFGLGEHSVYGLPLWNTAVSQGVAVYNQVDVEPNTWASRSDAIAQEIVVGAQPIPWPTRKKLIFDAKNHTYTDEITHRFLHEIAHGFIYANRESAGIHKLFDVASMARSRSQNLGLTAIGSLAPYNDQKRAREDTAELIAMYAFNPSRLQSYGHFLANPQYEAERSRVGLAEFGESANNLFEIVEVAVMDNLS